MSRTAATPGLSPNTSGRQNIEPILSRDPSLAGGFPPRSAIRDPPPPHNYLFLRASVMASRLPSTTVVARLRPRRRRQ